MDFAKSVRIGKIILGEVNLGGPCRSKGILDPCQVGGKPDTVHQNNTASDLPRVGSVCELSSTGQSID